MKGCRPLTDTEVALVVKSFGGTYASRDKALFVLGIKSGFRISELLSLTIGDVYAHGQVVARVTVRRAHMKRKGVNRPICRETANQILHDAYASNGLSGKLGTHSMRKTFANHVYDKLGHDLVKTQRAMGHKNINSTVSYLSFCEDDIDQPILAL
jgi:site-specific recombinase XerD